MRIDVETLHGVGRVDLDRPRGPLRAVAVLTHGANGDPDTVDLMAVRDALITAGVVVARVTQPYRMAGASSPSQPAKQDEAWLVIIDAIRKRRGLRALPLFVGGRSNGARLASRTANAAGATGVIALAFPVHPPGKPETSRLAELDAASMPAIVVQGDRDPFGMPPEADGRTLVVMPGVGHSLRRDVDLVATSVFEFVTSKIN